MSSNKIKELLFDYFLLFSILIITSLFIKKLVKDPIWLILNIVFWIFLIIGTGLLMYDKYLAFVIEVIIGVIIIVSILIYKNNEISTSIAASNNISREMIADPSSFNILFYGLILVSIITIISYFIINKFNYKTNNSDPKPGLKGDDGTEGEIGEESIVLNKPNNIVYEKLRVLSDDYFIKRKKELMKTWDYNNRKKYYKEEMPRIFEFSEREKQLNNISFYENIKRICNSSQFDYMLKEEIIKLFKEQKNEAELEFDMNPEYEYRKNLEYMALKNLLNKIEPAIYSAIDQICPNDLNDTKFLGIKFLNEDINYDITFYNKIKKDSAAYNNNIWGWGKKGCY